jgi:hypothetical protein
MNKIILNNEKIQNTNFHTQLTEIISKTKNNIWEELNKLDLTSITTKDNSTNYKFLHNYMGKQASLKNEKYKEFLKKIFGIVKTETAVINAKTDASTKLQQRNSANIIGTPIENVQDKNIQPNKKNRLGLNPIQAWASPDDIKQPLVSEDNMNSGETSNNANNENEFDGKDFAITGPENNMKKFTKPRVVQSNDKPDIDKAVKPVIKSTIQNFNRPRVVSSDYSNPNNINRVLNPGFKSNITDNLPLGKQAKKMSEIQKLQNGLNILKK